MLSRAALTSKIHSMVLPHFQVRPVIHPHHPPCTHPTVANPYHPRTPGHPPGHPPAHPPTTVLPTHTQPHIPLRYLPQLLPCHHQCRRSCCRPWFMVAPLCFPAPLRCSVPSVSRSVPALRRSVVLCSVIDDQLATFLSSKSPQNLT